MRRFATIVIREGPPINPQRFPKRPKRPPVGPQSALSDPQWAQIAQMLPLCSETKALAKPKYAQIA